MPFSLEALEELLEREKLTERALTRKLNKYTFVSHQTINNWRNKGTIPTMEKLDALYSFSRECGYDDLKFYQFPN